MNISVTYLLSRAGQKAAIALGINAAQKQTATIEDPDNIMLDAVNITAAGDAYISLEDYIPSLKRDRTHYYDHNVCREVIHPEIVNDYAKREFDAPILTLAGLTRAVTEFATLKAELLASIPALQAEIDMKYEIEKAAYITRIAKRVKRIPLTDGSGQWFDANKATSFDESTEWNGNNHISLATGRQWNHERLYRTASCKWILNHWSQRHGSRESYEQIEDRAAAAWLVTNGHDDPECAEKEIAALEIV